jgi:hypothetical protein
MTDSDGVRRSGVSETAAGRSGKRVAATATAMGGHVLGGG